MPEPVRDRETLLGAPAGTERDDQGRQGQRKRHKQLYNQPNHCGEWPGWVGNLVGGKEGIDMLPKFKDIKPNNCRQCPNSVFGHHRSKKIRYFCSISNRVIDLDYKNSTQPTNCPLAK
jgi:hypothetical protein